MVFHLPKVRKWEAFLLDKRCPDFDAQTLQQSISSELGIYFRQETQVFQEQNATLFSVTKMLVNQKPRYLTMMFLKDSSYIFTSLITGRTGLRPIVCGSIAFVVGSPIYETGLQDDSLDALIDKTLNRLQHGPAKSSEPQDNLSLARELRGENIQKFQKPMTSPPELLTHITKNTPGVSELDLTRKKFADSAFGNVHESRQIRNGIRPQTELKLTNHSIVKNVEFLFNTGNFPMKVIISGADIIAGLHANIVYGFSSPAVPEFLAQLGSAPYLKQKVNRRGERVAVVSQVTGTARQSTDGTRAISDKEFRFQQNQNPRAAQTRGAQRGGRATTTTGREEIGQAAPDRTGKEKKTLSTEERIRQELEREQKAIEKQQRRAQRERDARQADLAKRKRQQAERTRTKTKDSKKRSRREASSEEED
ncbi:hypothetical protein BLNAU_19445 [Blattamonas nauphoetae]|uniref:Uncharacterized protein n=1 Tax=Blattamonas nauphoetae TaxID=2049346 RepID=A0ABQ9X218_9EUKA|nr:hypothetical protein BLNAU_19445 [Blattamonas nauphoetae]